MIHSSPTFSVIIAVYNGAKTICRAIESVLSQTWPALEIIVVDDGSTDATADEVKRFGDTVRYVHQPHSGVSAARNKGAEVAKGEWLTFLDADDWYYSERLRWHADLIMRDPNLDFLTGDYEARRPDSSLIKRSIEKTEVGMLLLKKAAGQRKVIMEGEEIGLFITNHFGNIHTLTVPRKTFLELGGFPQEHSICEDVNLLIRLCLCSKRIGVICEPMAVYFIHGDSATRSNCLRAQQLTVEALLPLKEMVVTASPTIRKGYQNRLRRARLNLAYVLLRQRHRFEAIRTVLPSFMAQPGFGTLRDILSLACSL